MKSPSSLGAKLEKLAALAANNPNRHEALSALDKMWELIQNIQPEPTPKPWPEKLGRYIRRLFT